MAEKLSGPKALRWNGEYWYEDEGMLRRALHWLAWFGGWQAHSPRRPWSLGHRSLRERLRPSLLTPVTFFGHRVTFYGWGWELRLWGSKLVKSKSTLYLSPDGTPSNATVWFRGAPSEVRAAAAKSAAERQHRNEQLRVQAGGRSDA